MITTINEWKQIQERFISPEQLIHFDYNGIDIAVTEIEDLVINNILVKVDERQAFISYKTNLPKPAMHYGSSAMYKPADTVNSLSGQTYINIHFKFTSTLLQTNSVQEAIDSIKKYDVGKATKYLKYLSIL